MVIYLVDFGVFGVWVIIVWFGFYFVEGRVEYVDDFCVFIGDDMVGVFVLENWYGYMF